MNNLGLTGQMKELAEEVQDELDAELEELCKPAPKVPKVKDTCDLDELLNESVAIQKGKSDGKILREQLARAKDRVEAAEIEAKIRFWEATYEWDTLANCLLIRKQKCSCGSEVEHFVGMYHHQQHRTDKHAQRWVHAGQNLAGEYRLHEHANGQPVPNKIMKETVHVPICPSCANSQGFADLVEGVPFK